MPKTMQVSIVSTRPMMVASPAKFTMTLMSVDARPVMVMQPAMRPAMAHAAATVMQLRAPDCSAS